MILQIPFKEKTVDVHLPASWRLAGSLTGEPFPSIDLGAALEEALAAPIGATPPLEEDFTGWKICFVIDDATRPTPVHELFPTLLEGLLSRGAKKPVTVVVANGTHAPMSEEAIAARLGVSDLRGLNVRNHDCMDNSSLLNMGVSPSGMPMKIAKCVVEADLVVSIGTIEPHIMAGFGGGLKNIVPGCAGLDTISATHLLGPAAERFGNVGRFVESCAVRKRIEEASSLAVKRCFVVNTVLDANNRPVGLFCGEARSAHRRGAELARKVWGVRIDEKADILIGTSAPMIHDLCQGSKAFSTGIAGVRPGGLVMLFMECREGLGDYCVSPTSIPYERAREILRAEGTERYVELRREADGGGDKSFYEVFLTQSNAEALRKADVFIYCPDIPASVLNGFGLFKAFDSPEEMIAEASRLFPDGETKSVLYSPSGGTCFPYFD